MSPHPSAHSGFSTMQRSLTVLVLVAALLAAADLRADEPSQQVGKLDVRVRVQMNYLLYLPEKYEEREAWPLVLFLHGSGERGDDLALVKVHGPPKLIEAGREFPFLVVSPQCPKDHRWEPIELVALLDDIAKRYRVDASRVYVTGLSMGGFGTWELAAFAPERFAAIAPVCGGGERHWAKPIAMVPVWAFHGGKDTAVPVERSETMVEAVRKAGGEPKLTIYPEAGHDSWTETYDNPKLYEWLLEQDRGGAE